ncbi:MAG: tRNA (adenosine(37)-N6)-dimethylallyltransferase MiaA [Actinomycetota bacterium]
MARPEVLALVGPTASGKSALAHALARELGAEIVVADPFQRYRGLEIAADSPRPAERAEVPYHLVGDLALHESSRAGDFARHAHAAVDAIAARGRLAIVTGGTGLYVRAALAELDFSRQVPDAVRTAAEHLVAADPAAALDRLRGLDPAAAAAVDARNPRRLSRALELAEAGEPAARESAPLWTESTRRPTVVVGVTRPREVLHALIATRVRRELDDGLVAEIGRALDAPGGMSREAAQIIGVREVMALRDGTLDPAALEAALCARTRRLARRQATWLRKTPGVRWVDLGEAPPASGVPAVRALLSPP